MCITVWATGALAQFRFATFAQLPTVQPTVRQTMARHKQGTNWRKAFLTHVEEKQRREKFAVQEREEKRRENNFEETYGTPAVT